jgi:hypothetical protein
MYGFDPAERPKSGRRQREWVAQATTELAVVIAGAARCTGARAREMSTSGSAAGPELACQRLMAMTSAPESSRPRPCKSWCHRPHTRTASSRRSPPGAD